MLPNSRKQNKLALWFSVEGDVRFLSHRDTMRLWQKALARTRAPLKYSQGFNPHPRLSLPLPRSVAMASTAELLLVELVQPCPENLYRQLQDCLPAGIQILQACPVPADQPAVPICAQYRITLTTSADRIALQRRIDNFNNTPTHTIERQAHGRHPARTIDLRPAIAQLELEHHALIATVNISPQATPRISELLTLLQLDDPHLVKQITRTNTQYHHPLSRNN